MEWFSNLTGRQHTIVRWFFGIIGVLSMAIGGFFTLILIYGFWGYLEVSDMWSNNDRKRNLGELEDDVKYENDIDNIVEN